MKIKNNEGMSRRGFIRNAVLGAGIVTAAGLGAGKAMAFPPPLPKKWDRQTDVLIVGAGGAGLSAAIEAARAGAKVMVTEKQPVPGGSTAISGGQFTLAPTPMQKEQGINDSTELFYNDLIKIGKGKADPDLVKALVDNAASAFDFLTSVGAKFFKINTYAGMSVPRAHQANPGEVITLLRKEAEKRGATVTLNMAAVRLYANPNGRVVGAVVRPGKGKEISVRARKAVILASGGFGRGVDLLNEYGSLPLNLCIPMAAPGITGDGLKMAMDLGAATRDITMGIGPDLGPSTPVDVETRMITMPIYQGAVMVNKNAKRFAPESASYNVLSTVALSQPDALIYQIADSKVYAEAQTRTNSNKGKPRKADSIPDLAGMLGLDPQALQATIDRYNSYVDAGKDPEFNRTTLVGNSGKPVRIDTPPFYGYITKPAILSTKGGMRVNPKAQMVGIYGEVIPGLYTAGEMMGGVHGRGYITGTAIAKAIVFGRIAGKNAAGEK